MANFPGWGHLNSYLAWGGGNLNTIFQKFKCPGKGRGVMLKLRFDWYINLKDSDRLMLDMSALFMVVRNDLISTGSVCKTKHSS